MTGTAWKIFCKGRSGMQSVVQEEPSRSKPLHPLLRSFPFPTVSHIHRRAHTQVISPQCWMSVMSLGLYKAGNPFSKVQSHDHEKWEKAKFVLELHNPVQLFMWETSCDDISCCKTKCFMKICGKDDYTIFHYLFSLYYYRHLMLFTLITSLFCVTVHLHVSSHNPNRTRKTKPWTG